MVWGGRREEGSGWGTHVYLWWIHFDIRQNQYNIVKFKNKIKLQKKENVLQLKKKKRHASYENKINLLTASKLKERKKRNTQKHFPSRTLMAKLTSLTHL